DTVTEAQLTLELTLKAPSADDAGSSDASAPDAGPPAPVLTIRARAGATPVITDLWLYTLDGAGNKTPLTGFATSSPDRRVARRMLPATIRGQSSGLVPADDGNANGIMTDTTRGTFAHGTLTPGITGTVVVALSSAPASPILVVAGVEDERYAGAAVINPDGTQGTVPDGAFTLETHPRRSFVRDVAPLLKAQCGPCHNPTGPKNAGFYLVTGTRDELVNDNFTLREGTADCKTKFPDDPAALAQCIDALEEFETLVEPGAPAVSNLLVRSRPDENGSTSPEGLAWYGSRGSRYSTEYGDRRMPSTTQSTDAANWTNQPAYFDSKPTEYQILYDWVAQGAPP
ncbi:MAG TPA: hypothetical protein VNO21_14445, partial [Polyangiaceae bacterium]|nr:hypothetical protein [Polyangiaceae bacterium]